MKLGADLQEMSLARLMGMVSFCIVEGLIIRAACIIKADQIISLITAQTAIFTIIWAAITGKNVIELKKKNGGSTCGNTQVL